MAAPLLRPPGPRVASALPGVVSFPTANVDLLEGDATWTLSPGCSFPIGETVSGLVEAAFQPPAHGDPSSTVAGGSVTWLVRPRVQFDAYFVAGLTEAVTDLAAGCGFSVYRP